MSKIKKSDLIGEEVLRYMVLHSHGGIFSGSPREAMELLDVSSGALYEYLYESGVSRIGRGKNASWEIPKKIMNKYS